ncbi:MAG: phenylalanine--tRNA ligase subunit beta [Gammaproteobacteria bacterium]|nr:phenylalanine--tRNA ligase subunit beta [Gammaproteobacteria bacterium]
MKFSESWLRHLLKHQLSCSTEELCEQLTNLGLEVDECTTVAPPFQGIVIGEILEAVQHPDADRLRVCQVNTGGPTPLNIVCGAKNARSGIKVCVATVGAILPGDFVIKEAKLRGALSQGMLCSEKELGLTETLDGILELPLDAPLGQNVREYLDLDDHLISIELTPNRGDCLSLEGIAREIALFNQIPFVITEAPKQPTQNGQNQVKLTANQAAPLYCLQKISGVNNQGITPIWMRKHLERSGLRCISPVVDILNYVMLLTGQPMHAFDADKIHHPIEVCLSKGHEKTKLLNDTEITLHKDTLIIRDAENILALAGIMGCLDSSVTASTHTILLEAAFFSPLAIAGKARSYALHTDSSHRFERGVDPQLATRALNLAASLIGGHPEPIQIYQDTEYLPQPKPITLRIARIEKILGIPFSLDFIKKTLTQLQCQITQSSAENLTLTPPSFRFDLTIESDLIEELARIYGYNQIPSELPAPTLQTHFLPERITPVNALRHYLIASGLQEALTYSFIDPDWQTEFCNSPQYQLTNPMSSELAAMRQQVSISLLKILQNNINRQQESVKLFEVGPRFIGETAQEEWVLSGVLYGAGDFFALKGLIENILEFTHVKATFSKADLPRFLHPGQSVTLLIDQDIQGYLGRLHPETAQRLDLPSEVFIFEIKLSILEKGQINRIKPISKYPSIRRDLAFLVARNLPAGDLIAAIQSVHCDFLQDVTLFDVYEGDRLPIAQKSLAITLTLQHSERTLVDEEVQHYISKVCAYVKKHCDATLREG